MDLPDNATMQALLDQLRNSQAWRDITAPTNEDASMLSNVPPVASLDASVDPPASGVSEATSPSVASLLSQLASSTHAALNTSVHNSAKTTHSAPAKAPISSHPTPPAHVSRISEPALITTQDPRSLTYQQALPRLAQLANHEAFVTAIRQMKKEQDDLERQLWEDRRSVHRKYEEKVREAMRIAKIAGDSGLSQHEAEKLQMGLKKELEKFDRQRILVAWDGLISKQQTALDDLGVPTMLKTSDTAHRERQQRVMQVLEGTLD